MESTLRNHRAHATSASLPHAKAHPHPATMITATYEADETEYMAAVQQFKARTGRLFPTCSDMLSIAKSLGYSRPTSAGTFADANDREGL